MEYLENMTSIAEIEWLSEWARGEFIGQAASFEGTFLIIFNCRTASQGVVVLSSVVRFTDARPSLALKPDLMRRLRLLC